MFSITVPEKVINTSLEFMRGYSTDKSAMTANKKQILAGVIGENTIRYLLRLPRMEYLQHGDNGVDVVIHGKKVDVKTMLRTVDPRIDYANNFKATSMREADILLFTSLNEKAGMLTVCGWLPTEEFISKATLFPKGAQRPSGQGMMEMWCDTYEIMNRDINYNAGSLDELLSQIKSSTMKIDQQWVKEYEKWE